MDEPDLDYPYLIPIGEGRTVDFVRDSKYFYINNFKMNNRDSIYCMRKGIVTALPDLSVESERIIKTGSLEIRHKDGTVAVYRNIDSELCKLRIGETVYPGQLVGEIISDKNLIVTIYQLIGDGKIRSIDNKYICDNNRLLNSGEISNEVVVFPKAIVEKEMSKREIKKKDKS